MLQAWYNWSEQFNNKKNIFCFEFWTFQRIVWSERHTLIYLDTILEHIGNLNNYTNNTCSGDVHRLEHDFPTLAGPSLTVTSRLLRCSQVSQSREIQNNFYGPSCKDFFSFVKYSLYWIIDNKLVYYYYYHSWKMIYVYDENALVPSKFYGSLYLA